MGNSARKRYLVLLLLFAFLVSGRYAIAKEFATEELGVVRSGISDACWRDNQTVAFLQGVWNLSTHAYDKITLAYADVSRKPAVVSSVELGNGLSNLAPWAAVSCQGGNVIVDTFSPTGGTRRVYVVRPGEPAELISDLRGRLVNLQEKYVVGSNVVMSKAGQLGTDQCNVVYLKPGYRLLCWGRQSIGEAWPQNDFVLGMFRWDETIRVVGADGATKRIPNPLPPAFFADTNKKTPAYTALVIYELDGRIAARIDGSAMYKLNLYSIAADSIQNEKLYLPCRVFAESQDRSLLDYNAICKNSLRERSDKWEEVFRYQPHGVNKIHILHASVGQRAIAFTVIDSTSRFANIWLYDMDSKTTMRITGPNRSVADENPKISPNGRYIAFRRAHEGQTKLWLARIKQ